MNFLLIDEDVSTDSEILSAKNYDLINDFTNNEFINTISN